MSKVFRITPKRPRRVNGQVITPEMVITVTTRQHCTNPFYNGAVEVNSTCACTSLTSRKRT